MNLPPGFTEGLWTGWTKFSISAVHRCMANHKWVRVMKRPDGFWVQSAPDMVTRSEAETKGLSQREALAWANAYAEKHGGWQDAGAGLKETGGRKEK